MIQNLNRICAQLNDIDFANHPDLPDDEHIRDAINKFSINCHLIVYGSLAPHQSNHHIVKNIPGKWFKGQINGYVKHIGWGANMGYPGLIWKPSGPALSASILESADLHLHWKRLDEFEGTEYKRIIIPFLTPKNKVGLGHVYSLAVAL